MNKISFHFNNVSIELKNRQLLKRFITDLFKQENTHFSKLDYIFCTDSFLLGLNKVYLQHDYFTDIITFNLADTHTPVIGELYISTDRVRENAKILGLAFREELLRVMFHGALHLCGYVDKRLVEKDQMTFKENFYLELYANVSRGT